MPVTDELRAIAKRADRELDAVHDFFEHSKLVWVVPDPRGQGHKIAAENLATGTRIDQDGLVRLAPQYTANTWPPSPSASSCPLSRPSCSTSSIGSSCTTLGSSPSDNSISGQS